MDKIILDLKKEIEKQGLSETKAAALAGVEQRTVNRMLAGKTKKPDIEVIKKLQVALGLVAEPETIYAVSGIHQQVTPEENELLRYFRQLCPDQRSSAMQMVKGLLLLTRQSRKNEGQESDLKELKSA
jgi:transcriptional regulator with XRE-family HTH domain